MKISLRFALLALLLWCGTARAQVTPVVINPAGGNGPANDLMITITESNVLVKYKGKKQYNEDAVTPLLDRGMRTYFMLERFWGSGSNELDTLHVAACEISDVHGDGSDDHPWTVVKLLTFENVTNATFNVSVIYTYFANRPWYQIDYIASSNEKLKDGPLYGPYLVHIYHSERTWVHEVNCGFGFADQNISTAEDAYRVVHFPMEGPVLLNGRVGIRKSDGACSPAPAGAHFFRAAGGIPSYYAGATSGRDVKGALGYTLMDNLNTIEGPDVGVAIHKAMLLDWNPANLISHKTQRFIVGFDEADDGINLLENPTLALTEQIPFSQAEVELSSDFPEGLEGDDDHVINGVTLRVKNGQFNLPQIVHFKVTTLGTDPEHAVDGTDFEVHYSKMIIPPGNYTDDHLPLSNILIHGNEDQNEDKRFKIELLSTCSPHLVLGDVVSAEYKIVDDDENRIFLEPDLSSLKEGEEMQVKVKMTGVALGTDLPVTISTTPLTAETTDYLMPADNVVIIPAGNFEATFTFKAVGDRIIENEESLDITATATIGADIQTHEVNIKIVDTTGDNPDNRIITFAALPADEGTDMTITASLPDGVTAEEAITVDLTAETGGTAETADFGALPAQIVIPANNNSGSFLLHINTDNKIELDEYFYFSGAVAGGFYDVIGPVQLILKDKSDAPAPQAILEIGDTYPSEVDPVSGAASFGQLKLLNYVAGYDMVFNLYIDASSTADAGDISGTLSVTIPKDGNIGTFSFKVVKDQLLEEDETLVFAGSLNGLVIEHPEESVITIIDDDITGNKQIAWVDVTPLSLTEGDEVDIKVKLNDGITAAYPITVNFTRLTGSTAVTPADYVLNPPATVTIAPGDTEATIRLTTIADGVPEGNELLKLRATATFSIYSPVSIQRDITIHEPVSGNIVFTSAETVLPEGGSLIKVTAALESGNAPADIVITLDGLTGSTTVAEDVEMPATVTILAGTPGIEFDVRAVNDDVLEKDETFNLGGTTPGYTITGTAFNVTDATSLVAANTQLTLEVVNNLLTEGSTTQVWVKLPPGITTAEAIDITLSSGPATELLSGEYTFPATVTIPANGDKIVFTLGAVADNILELEERLELLATGSELLTGVSASTMVDVPDLTGTIAANKLVTVTASGTTVNEGGSVIYTFSLPSLITTSEALTIYFTPESATTAAPDDFADDYPISVTIPANGSATTYTLTAVSDGVIESQEKLRMTLSLPAFTFNSDVIDVDVIDTDLGTPVIQLSLSSAGVVNEGGTVTVRATLQGFTADHDIVVGLFRNSTSTTDATADHNALGTITIGANDPYGEAIITTLTDLVLEHDEYLVLEGTSTGFDIDGATLTIKDITGTPANKVISIVPPAASLTEGDDMTVIVKLPDGVTASEDIDVTISTGAGTVLLGSEYSIAPAAVKILAGDNAAEFIVTANTDDLIEPDELLVLEATATVYGAGPNTTTASIQVKDPPGSNTITISGNTTVTEDNTAVIRFSLPGGVTSTSNIVIQIPASGTAVAADFEDLPATVTITAGEEYEELVLQAKKDNRIEAPETLILTPSATGYIIMSATAELVVTDADINSAEIKLAPSPATIEEGNTLTLTATLQGGMTTDIPIDITLSADGGTAEITDYAALTTIQIASGATGSVNIAIPEDEFLEWSETLIIKGDAPGITVEGTTINITDKNGTTANKTFTLTPDATSIVEGGNTVVWVRLPAGQKTEEAITVGLAAGSATTATLDNTEYSFPASVEIPAGGDAISFTLTATEDDLLEPVETLQIKATASIYGSNITIENVVDITDEPGNNIITVSGDTEVTEGNTATILFDLPAGITTVNSIVINLAASGTADAADFVSIPATVTIPAGSRHGEIVLNAKKEGIIEATEKLVLTPQHPDFTFDKNAELDVEDADAASAAIILTATPSPILEGNDITVTATLQGSVTATTAIDIPLSKTGSQADGTDHSPLGTIRIEPGDASGTFTITAKTDLILERDETLVLGGTAGSIPVTGTTVVIQDATERNITLTPATATVAENDKVTFTLSLPASVTTTENITVTLAKASGTTVIDGEYNLPPTVIIPVNGNQVTFDVDALPDDVLEPDELLNIIATATVFGDAKTATAAITVTDATGTPANKLITISGDTEVTEGNTATVEFRLPPGITTAQAVVITFTPGTASPAVAANDITGGIPVSAIIPAGGHEAILTVPVIADAVIEPVEKLFLVPAAGGFTFSNNVMLDVLDQHHSGTITLSSDVTAIHEGNGTATITVSLPGALTAGSDIQVDIAKAAASSATAADHAALPPSVTIENGQHEVKFTITAPPDQILEETETLLLEGSAAGYSVAGTAIQIEDATSLDPLNTVLKLMPQNTSLAEGATGDFFVRLPAGIVSSKDITVQLAKTAGASTAADTDHTQIPVSVTIPAMSNSSADTDISAVPDLIIEPEEKLRIDGTAPAGFTFEGTDIRITDATALNPANMEIRISLDSAVLHEGNTSKVIFALPANITSSTDITIQVTADATFSAGQADYSLTPATVVIPKDNNQVTVILEALQDNLSEAGEQLKLTGTATGYTIIPSNALNIPGEPAPQVTVTVQKTADAAEPSVNGAFTIQLSAVAPGDVTVAYAIAGTATGGQDYEPLTGQAVIKAGETSAVIPVTIKDDAIVEGAESVELTLQSAVFAFFSSTVNCTLGNSAASLQIGDNDQAGIVIEKVADATEPATGGSVRIRFSNPQTTSTVPVTVQYAVSGTATAGLDYDALSGSAVIPAGSKEVIVPVTPKDDNQLEGTETVIIQLTSATAPLPGTTWPIEAPQEASLNLYDNDVVSMEIFGLNQVAEGAVIPVTLKASQPTSADIPVTITLQHDAARTITTTVPRTGSTLTVTMPANQTEVTFNITLEENDVNDDNGYVNLVIQPYSGSGQAYGKGASSNTATVVTDNDPLEISFKKDSARLKEGNNGISLMPFTIQLSRMSSRAIQLQYAFADAFEGAGADKDPERAKAGEDYEAAVTSITIPPMQSEADITVPVIGDTKKEADKYFAVKLTDISVAGGRNVPVTGSLRTAIGVIENDDQDVDREVRPHKGVSPNGDGKNDVWIIENIEKYNKNEVVIVNRWGGTIFKTSNYNNASNNFSGLANIGSGTGKELPDGSYFYILQVWENDGKVTRYNGYIVIKNGL